MEHICNIEFEKVQMSRDNLILYVVIQLIWNLLILKLVPLPRLGLRRTRYVLSPIILLRQTKRHINSILMDRTRLRQWSYTLYDILLFYWLSISLPCDWQLSFIEECMLGLTKCYFKHKHIKTFMYNKSIKSFTKWFFIELNPTSFVIIM